MWLATKHGFFSIVQKSPGEYHVRARIRGDLENLIVLVNMDLQIHCWPSADYRYRIIVGDSEFSLIMANLALSLDYHNFKTKIAHTPDQQAKLESFHEIWAIIARLQQD